ncbi:hypothetical protein WK80_29845 [Burkholderia multivorans]|uniref:hypothetical protein n=1 Tax=Burkholderia multivorans TaxID=87883 RepID=UPI0007531EA7|nr:hypothetical protein [Burkholderia multivorans]KVV17368.1 hypothetical protein WK80_29845 [Burkholderia multivorans]MBU9203527.1 hypothetical protein [Burkholderia multivorans]MCA8386563.1 hypothetical protein [Burkholderia multivorans]MCO8320249.1 hypothetical protein [Burkholderia multivorans]MCO8354326.1 hypothetical protein [Burkholderia multivorans]
MSRAFAFFQRVIGLIRKQLERIAGSSQGDHSVEDLTNEAWLIVDELHLEPDASPDPEDQGVRDLIVARLQREFGRFVNRQERFATRIDRDDVDDDGDFMPNAIAARLSAPEKYEPLASLEMREEAAAAARIIGERFSEAVAYLRTFERFDGDKVGVARHLAIDLRALHRRVARASHVERTQRSMFDGIEEIPVDFMPLAGRWRATLIAPQYRGACAIAWPVQLQLFMRSCKLFFSRRRKYW